MSKRYGQWSGNPAGKPYNPDKCIYEVCGKLAYTHQCTRPNGNGPDGLYCKQHAKKKAALKAILESN